MTQIVKLYTSVCVSELCLLQPAPPKHRDIVGHGPDSEACLSWHRKRRLWASKGASASVYALLACTALMQPYRKFVWLFGVELNSLG